MRMNMRILRWNFRLFLEKFNIYLHKLLNLKILSYKLSPTQKPTHQTNINSKVSHTHSSTYKINYQHYPHN